MQLQGARGATFGASNAFFNTQILATQTGGIAEVVDGAKFTKYDILTLDADKKAKLTATIEGEPTKVFALAKDNSLVTAKPMDESAYTYATGEITVTAGAEGDRILVVYTATAKGEKITALANAQNELMNVTAEVLLRELCAEELYYAFINLRGKLSGEAEWAMARDGQHAFEITCMPEYCTADRKLVEVIIVKGEDMIAA